MTLAHVLNDRSVEVTLDGYRDAIVREVDGVALRVGLLLREAKQAAPERFERWVVDDLPFGLETARRLMSISAAYEKLPTAMLENLPRPWQAMYALKELPAAALEQAMIDGTVNPSMTVERAREFGRLCRGQGYKYRQTRRGDDLAGHLMAYKPSELSDGVRVALQAWLVS